MNADALALPRLPASCSVAETFPRRDLSLYRALAFGVGFLLPLLTLKTGYYGTPTDLASRVALVDLACLALIAVLVVRGSPAAVPVPGVVYFFALVLSLIPALVFFTGPEATAWTSFAAIMMGFLFYVLGLSIGRSRVVMSALLAGVAVVTLLEAVVVYHDYFFSSQWFPDPMAGRARGTFKANGQLGAYGFCAAGLLLVLGSGLESRRLRNLCLFSGLVAASFVFTASRRTGMICVFAWGILFAVLGVKFAQRRFYRAFVAILLLVILAMGISWGTVSQSFAGKRLSEGLDQLSGSDSFIKTQHAHIVQSADQWFPFGFGPGRGRLIDPTDIGSHEIHNGLLAVLVEQGVLGLLGFVAMMLLPLFRPRLVPGLGGGRSPSANEPRAIQATLLLSFILICFVFVIHNTLYRDRTFLLFLGMATAIARAPRLPRAGELEEVL